MNDADREILRPDVDDPDRPIDTRSGVDRFHFFVADVGGRRGLHARLRQDDSRRKDERNSQHSQDYLFHEVSPFAAYYTPISLQVSVGGLSRQPQSAVSQSARA